MTSAPIFRKATAKDVPSIVQLLFDDELGKTREVPSDLTPYAAAFEQITANPDAQILVAELDGRVVGTLQLNFIQHMTYKGSYVAQIEAVRVASECRSRGVGEGLMKYALDKARARRCHRAQLTTNKARNRAHKFYEKLGFVASHEGMKLIL